MIYEAIVGRRTLPHSLRSLGWSLRAPTTTYNIMLPYDRT